MRNIVAIVFVVSLVFVTLSTQANARQPYSDAFKEKYAPAGSPYEQTVEMAKCNVCHIDKKPKNMRNAYGIALSKVIAKNEKGKGKINGALEKIEAEKSPSGETFGERIKAGKLPAE